MSETYENLEIPVKTEEIFPCYLDLYQGELMLYVPFDTGMDVVAVPMLPLSQWFAKYLSCCYEPDSEAQKMVDSLIAEIKTKPCL